MRNSVALGFYARNAEVMDELWEAWEAPEEGSTGSDYPELLRAHQKENGLPIELVDLVEKNQGLIERILSGMEQDLRSLENAAQRRLEELGCRYARKRRSHRSDWEGRLKLVPTDGRVAKSGGMIVLGWEWVTRNDCAFVECWVWVTGGRRIEEMVKLAVLKNGRPEPATADSLLKSGVWQQRHSGTVRLLAINVSEMVKDDFALDLEELERRMMSAFECVDRSTIDRFFQIAMENRA